MSQRVYVDVQFTGWKKDPMTGEKYRWTHGCAEDELEESLAVWRKLWPRAKVVVVRKGQAA